MKKIFYDTYQEASNAAYNLGIKNQTEYALRYKEDSYLCCNPYKKYNDVWAVNGSWPGFLKTHNATLYKTWENAHKATIKLNIFTVPEYSLRYKEDPKLPSTPHIKYKSEWTKNNKWIGYLENPRPFYPDWVTASKAAIKLNIESYIDYKKRHRDDHLLPKNPKEIYSSEWNKNNSWRGFLGLSTKKKKYYSCWELASTAAKSLNINNAQEYYIKSKLDTLLPPSPHNNYCDEWKKNDGWYGFLNKKRNYPDWNEASKAAQKLKIFNSETYLREHTKDPQLPKHPESKYKKVWLKMSSWKGFLIPKTCNNLSDLKQCMLVLNIKSSTEYKHTYKQYPQFPAHPERKYKNEWIDWYDFLGIPKPYSYEESISRLKKQNLSSIVAYNNYLVQSKDLHFPRNPDQVYFDKWINWYVYLSREEPFKSRFIYKPYETWADEISIFLKKAKGGGSKETNLCKFVKLYIIKNDLEFTPTEFLTTKEINVELFIKFINEMPESSIRRNIVTAINEFLDHIIHTKLTLEDEDTGELLTIPEVINPFKKLYIQEYDSPTHHDETTKPALSYQYVKKMKNWIIPSTAQTFRDLINIHQFDADWIEVDPSIINKNDPDCVFKETSKKTLLWFPCSWLHAYTIASVPARGRQIAYNDSGESDNYIADIQNQKVIWIKNTSEFSDKHSNNSFIKRYPDEKFGMHFTTNKTSSNTHGYDVPWMPYELAYWLIRLQKWQSKYNPIDKPTPWTECINTNMNEEQLKSKGSNCFLFRHFNTNVPGLFSSRLTDRIAAALYHSQPNDIVLAKHTCNTNTLSHYKSEYTPHSMRVSLITAYVMEFGLPIEIIMKVVGHSSIVMSIYYLKINSEEIRDRFSIGEKKAFKNKAYAAQRMIEQKRIDTIKHELISNSKETLNSLSNNMPVGNFLFRDYGICPTAGTRCSDGGNLIDKSKIRSSVSSGYLGAQNCLRCRHFITGPVFLGGLLSLSNEISLQSNHQAVQYSELQICTEEMTDRIEALNEIKYDSIKSNKYFDDTKIYELEIRLRKTESEVESAAIKLDTLLCDLQAATRLIKQSHALVNDSIHNDNQNNNLQLVTSNDHDLHLAVNETSYFQQLCEVCENAEIYESASGDLAVPNRSQLLDKMAMHNNIQPQFFALNKKQQLLVGNQMTTLLLSRLKTWKSVDALIEGRILLDDLTKGDALKKSDIEQLFKQQAAIS